MELQKVMEERYSVRAFSSRMIEEEKLNRILEAGRIAPTAKNNQPQHIYVLKSEEAIQRVRALTRCAYNAPVVLLIAVDKGQEWNNPLEDGITSGQQDAAIVATHMMLSAWDQGIGSCWVCYMAPSEIHDAFGLPESEQVALLMPIGYPAEEAKPSPNHASRKPLSETVTVL
jgi:Nitroreductase